MNRVWLDKGYKVMVGVTLVLLFLGVDPGARSGNYGMTSFLPEHIRNLFFCIGIISAFITVFIRAYKSVIK